MNSFYSKIEQLLWFFEIKRKQLTILYKTNDFNSKFKIFNPDVPICSQFVDQLVVAFRYPPSRMPLTFAYGNVDTYRWNKLIFLFWFSKQLFGDNDIFQQYGIPMNPTDNTSVPELMNRQRGQNDASPNPQVTTAAGSELISYQPSQTPIDFTDFLNLEDDQQLNALNAPGSFANKNWNMSTTKKETNSKNTNTRMSKKNKRANKSKEREKKSKTRKKTQFEPFKNLNPK